MNPEGNSSGNSGGWPTFGSRGRGRGSYPFNNTQPGAAAATHLAAAFSQMAFRSQFGMNFQPHQVLPLPSTSSGLNNQVSVAPFFTQEAGPSGLGPSSTMEALPWTSQPGDATNLGSSLFQNSSDDCAICTQNRSDLHIFLPCEHYPYCSACMKSMSLGTPGIMKCPHCKQRIVEVRKVTRVEKIKKK